MNEECSVGIYGDVVQPLIFMLSLVSGYINGKIYYEY